MLTEDNSYPISTSKPNIKGTPRKRRLRNISATRFVQILPSAELSQALACKLKGTDASNFISTFFAKIFNMDSLYGFIMLVSHSYVLENAEGFLFVANIVPSRMRHFQSIKKEEDEIGDFNIFADQIEISTGFRLPAYQHPSEG